MSKVFVLLLPVLSLLAGGCGSPPPESLALGTGPQLFVDDFLIARKEGIDRTLHPARKLEQPVLEADRPWEGRRVYVYGTVHYDPDQQLFQMWYLARLGPGYEGRCPGLGRHGDLLLYATSRDGIAWEKPNLGLYEFDGSRENNIVLLNLHSPAVIVDPEAPAKERYKLVAWNWEPERYGYWKAHSADGLTWKEYEERPVIIGADDVLEAITVAQHPLDKTHFAFHRQWKELGGHKRRAIAVAKSSDFQNWSAPELILVPDEQDDTWVQNPEQRTEFYNLAGFSYGDQLLGLLPVFQVVEILELDKSISVSNQAKWDGPIEAQLVHSRDGSNWERFEDRSPILPRGAPGSFDAGCILALANPPLVYNEEVWVYYTGVNTTHGGAMPPKRIALGRASWREDGFVSLDAGDSGGVIETVLLRPSGDELEVNVDASEGSLAVEALSWTGEPLAGYELDDCEPIRGDRVRQIVRWKGKDRLDMSQPLQLRFRLQNAKLYSFRIR